MAAGDKIKSMSVELSKRVADEVATYDLNGESYTSVQRLRAMNDARIKIYNILLAKLGIDEFIRTYPEFVAESDRSYAVAANVGATHPAFRKIISCKLIRLTAPAGPYDGTYNCRELPLKEYYELLLDDASSPFATSSSDYGYMNIGAGIRFFGEFNGVITGTYYLIYLKDIVDIAYTEDAPDPFIWQSEVIETAAEILLSQSTKN